MDQVLIVGCGLKIIDLSNHGGPRGLALVGQLKLSVGNYQNFTCHTTHESGTKEQRLCMPCL